MEAVLGGKIILSPNAIYTMEILGELKNKLTFLGDDDDTVLLFTLYIKSYKQLLRDHVSKLEIFWLE